MTQKKRLLFKLNAVRKLYGKNIALVINKLQIHPGTIYGVVGSIGSGKTTLLDILSGIETENSGDVLYEDKTHKKNWFGTPIQNKEIFYQKYFPENKSINDIIDLKFKRKKNIIKNRYFKEFTTNKLLKRKMADISDAEKNWFGMVMSFETDPRVLLIDDYGIHFCNNLETDFRSQILKMNRNLGTTVILTAPTDNLLKNFVSVLIYLDKGKISKIRSGFQKKTFRKFRKNRKKSNKNNH